MHSRLVDAVVAMGHSSPHTRTLMLLPKLVPLIVSVAPPASEMAVGERAVAAKSEPVMVGRAGSPRALPHDGATSVSFCAPVGGGSDVHSSSLDVGGPVGTQAVTPPMRMVVVSVGKLSPVPKKPLMVIVHVLLLVLLTLAPVILGVRAVS